MKKATKAAGLALAAVVTLAACATDSAVADGNAELLVTGEGVHLSYTDAHAQRDALIEQYYDGVDVSATLAYVCHELAGLDSINVSEDYTEQWILDCQSPDLVWDAGSNTWVHTDDAISYN